MADEPQSSAISAAFPAPPPYYKSFTPENLERLRQYIEPSSQTSSEILPSTALAPPSIPSDIASLPPELRNLLPPPPPPDGNYRTFGVTHNLHLPTPNPHPPTPTRTRLTHLLHALLLHFLSITHALATNPAASAWAPKWDELKATFEEAHRVINEYRPHQARETLILMMEDQVRGLRGEIGEVREGVERARGVLRGIAGGGEDEEGDGEKRRGGGDGLLGGKREGGRGREKRVWEVIEREVGGVVTIDHGI